MLDISILIPAAGASSRMRGRDKLTEDVEGLPLLRRQALRAIDTGAHVAVTLPEWDHPRAAALEGLPVQVIEVPDSDLGMSASIRRGVGLMPRGIKAMVILPADMPEIESEDILKLINGFQSLPFPMLQQATAEDGTPGHPVLFPADCFMALQTLTGDKGARDVLRANAHRTRQIPLEGQRALTDLDTPEAWKAWRASQGDICAAE
ncbi:nucleotidyltransferase family protein [Mameliella sediminis]|uniref:nucleotidyltransferase family protein n=1 Tax=Mameliella sediminis TaxID=2836866 RepID=UPI001C492371|nr:nucleotidyltransferase family protein [Mameliella sediminis]MBY6114536.1 nucleotidyltransferase family protein [Antarctobacter heliothermus]MBY6144109.1 nucleotidyltransferase family protein [Mameliella alba]MBV7392983.1 nucleotidyltransferase family protein [Mameliella sediminis]MBY6161599.1 nucleotidyltransferase family protein [Mameliella alba]MBY6169935.1 nucleotidyltransferase family protein [Mameliella alba]